VPAGSDDSSFVQLRTTLEVVAAEHKLHLREPEVRGFSSTNCREVRLALRRVSTWAASVRQERLPRR